MTKPGRPTISVVFVIIGILGLLGSMVFLIDAIDSRGPTSSLLVGSAFSGVLGSLLLFAISYALARLHEISEYQRQILLDRLGSRPAKEIQTNVQSVETLSESSPTFAVGVSDPPVTSNLGLWVLIGIGAIVFGAIVLIQMR